MKITVDFSRKIVDFISVKKNLFNQFFLKHLGGAMKKIAAIIAIGALTLFSQSFAQKLSGDYIIGSGGDYPNLRLAIADINANGASGIVRFLIDENLTERGDSLIINRQDFNADSFLVIKPNAGEVKITITAPLPSSGHANNQGFTIAGADYVVIDGSSIEGGYTRDLTISLDVATGAYVLGVMEDAWNCVIKNTIVTYDTMTAGGTLIGCDGYTSAPTGVPKRLLIENCQIGSPTKAVTNGIGLWGNDASMLLSATVRNCEIYSTRRIITTYFNEKCSFYNNYMEVVNPRLDQAFYSGMYLTGFPAGDTVNIFKNVIRVSKLNVSGATTRFVAPIVIYGNDGVLNIYNNYLDVANIKNAGTNNGNSVFGVVFNSTGWLGTANIFNNTIYVDSSNQTGRHACIGYHTINSNFKGNIVNNIMINNQNAANSYGIYWPIAPSPSSVLISNYNNIYLPGASAFTGRFNTTNYASLSEWQSGTGQDQKSSAVETAFENVSAGEFELVAPCLGDYNFAGLPIPWITDDIHGTFRNAKYPYKGAYESLVPIIPPTVIPPVSWIAVPVSTTENLRSVDIVDENVIWAMGGNGAVIRSTNGGGSFEVVGTISVDGAHYIAGIDDQIALIATGPNSGNGEILKTTDGGSTWNQVHTATGAWFNFIDNVNDTILWAQSDPIGGFFHIVKSIDQGETWTPILNPIPEPASNVYGWFGVFYRIGQVCWFGTGGFSGVTQANRIYKSETGPDGPWTFYNTNFQVPNTVAFFDTNSIGIAGFSPTFTTNNLDISEDGGKTWTTQPVPGVGTTYAIDVAPECGMSWMSASTGTWFSIDSGKVWERKLIAGANAVINDIKFLLKNDNEYLGIGVGNSGAIIKATTDEINYTVDITAPIGGETYQIQDTIDITWNSLNIDTVQIAFSSNGGTNWYLVGYAPASEGTYSWIIPNVTAGSQWKVMIRDYKNLLLLDSSARFTVNPRVGVDLDKSIPKAYALQQNYPNPFNPSTTIKFELPKESKVELKVYNAIGQEVASLINTVMSAGYHEIRFNASHLATGVYIYRINAGEFTATKKMMLIK